MAHESHNIAIWSRINNNCHDDVVFGQPKWWKEFHLLDTAIIIMSRKNENEMSWNLPTIGSNGCRARYTLREVYSAVVSPRHIFPSNHLQM